MSACDYYHPGTARGSFDECCRDQSSRSGTKGSFGDDDNSDYETQDGWTVVGSTANTRDRGSFKEEYVSVTGAGPARSRHQDVNPFEVRHLDPNRRRTISISIRGQTQPQPKLMGILLNRTNCRRGSILFIRPGSHLDITQYL